MEISGMLARTAKDILGAIDKQFVDPTFNSLTGEPVDPNTAAGRAIVLLERVSTRVDKFLDSQQGEVERKLGL